jgi:hypothetical protein
LDFARFQRLWPAWFELKTRWVYYLSIAASWQARQGAQAMHAIWNWAGAAALAVAAGLAAFGPSTAGAQSDALVLQALEPQTLEEGQCGLFLWSLGERPQLVLVAYDRPSGALISSGGRERYLSRTAFGGEQSSGHFERQTFSGSGLTLSVELSWDPTRQVRDGSVVREAQVTLTDRDGWETVVPAGGMSGCQRNPPRENR